MIPVESLQAGRLAPRFWFCMALVVASAACGDDSDATLPCVEKLDAQCEQAFTPTWDNVYEFVIEQRCGGSSGGNCHGPQGLQGGLGLYTQTVAYEGLVGGVGGEPRVLPGDPACSELMKRIETSDTDLRMPLQGAALPPRDRCAIQKWIAAGAEE
jgi:Planctomycete cytochrome C